MAAANTQRNYNAASVPASTAPAVRPRIDRRSCQHDRAESGDDERRAQRTKEIHGAGRDAELVHCHRILHHDDGEREGRAQSESGKRDQAEVAQGEKPVGASASGASAAIESRMPAKRHPLVMGISDE